MKKIVALCLTLMLILPALSGCGPAAPAPTPEPTAAPTAEPTAAPIEEAQGEEVAVLQMRFVDPESSPYVQGGQRIAELVEQATGGRVRIEVAGGDSRGERALIELAMDGQLDIATCANSVMTNYIPQMNILDQAYLWKNADEAHAAVDGRIGTLVRERAETLGLHVLGFLESGFRNTFATRPIRTMADFEGVTIRTMENKYHQAAFEAFGATPIAMAYQDVFPALKEGTIDACENATANCLNSGYYEVTKHVTNTQHALVYILLCMSDAAWQRIPEELREPFMAAVQEGVAWERQRLIEANAEAEEKLRELGVSFEDIDIPALQAAYQKAAAAKGFTFDEDWQAAVQEAVESVK